MKNLAIIPARSGSKGLIDKNIMLMNGKPLLWYSIEAAKKSGCFDEIMVSTDSEKYANIAKECGAKVPFLRSKKTSSDKAGSWDVVIEVLENYSMQGRTFDYVALLQPTSPLRTSDDIINAFQMIKSNKSNAVVSVCEVDHPVQWCFKLDEDCSMRDFANSEYCNMRRQELDKYYHENGAIYIVMAEKIVEEKYNLYADNCSAYTMSREKSIDIDDGIDAIVAEELLKRRECDCV